MLCLPRNLHMEVHKVLHLPRHLHMEVHKVLCRPRNLHMEVHKALRLPRNLHFKRPNHNGRPTDHDPRLSRNRRSAELDLPGSGSIEKYSISCVRYLSKTHFVLHLPRNLHLEVHKVLHLLRNLHMEVHKALCLPRNLHMEVHKALCLT